MPLCKDSYFLKTRMVLFLLITRESLQILTFQYLIHNICFINIQKKYSHDDRTELYFMLFLLSLLAREGSI